MKYDHCIVKQSLQKKNSLQKRLTFRLSIDGTCRDASLRPPRSSSLGNSWVLRNSFANHHLKHTCLFSIFHTHHSRMILAVSQFSREQPIRKRTLFVFNRKIRRHKNDASNKRIPRMSSLYSSSSACNLPSTGDVPFPRSYVNKCCCSQIIYAFLLREPFWPFKSRYFSSVDTVMCQTLKHNS